jgi:hypothetical protein
MAAEVKPCRFPPPWSVDEMNSSAIGADGLRLLLFEAVARPAVLPGGELCQAAGFAKIEGIRSKNQ